MGIRAFSRKNLVWPTRRTASALLKLAGLIWFSAKVWPCGHKFPLNNNDRLWRLFRADDDLTWDVNLGWIPNPLSNALKMNPDLSTSWREHLARYHEAGPADLLSSDARYSLVAEAAAKELRDLQFGVRHSPDGGVGPFACAHSSVDWPQGSITPPAREPTRDIRRALRYDLSRKFHFIYGPLPPPPDGYDPPTLRPE